MKERFGILRNRRTAEGETATKCSAWGIGTGGGSDSAIEKGTRRYLGSLLRRYAAVRSWRPVLLDRREARLSRRIPGRVGWRPHVCVCMDEMLADGLLQPFDDSAAAGTA